MLRTTLASALLANCFATGLSAQEPARPMPLRTLLQRFQSESQRRIQTKKYEFKQAGKEMSYALFVPSKYDAEKKWPLIVALHGLGSNPQQIMHYRGLTDLAEEQGYVVVAPMGYNERGGYGSWERPLRPGDPENIAELSEQDVMNVLELTRKELNIDERRIYLLGHSMGGAGTWHLAVKHPDIWAALAAIAPAPARDAVTGLEKIKRLPAIVVQGDEDNLVPVEGTRRLVERMKDLGMEHVYIEVKGGNHLSVAAENLPEIFEFFDRHSKSHKPAP